MVSGSAGSYRILTPDCDVYEDDLSHWTDDLVGVRVSPGVGGAPAGMRAESIYGFGLPLQMQKYSTKKKKSRTMSITFGSGRKKVKALKTNAEKRNWGQC